MNGGGITLSLQNFVQGFLLVSNYNCLLKGYALLLQFHIPNNKLKS
jgi:hypothetical protein